MGSGLTKPVTTVVLKRRVGRSFRVGIAEMNGMRPQMEDAHVIHLQDRWGFFGVYDGHGGQVCSEFIALRTEEELAKGGLPKDRAAVKDLCLRLDQEFLDLKVKSGSTGTFVIVELPESPDAKFLLRVGNIGDSRVLLAHADGRIYQGPGTDSGLTTDHKPNNPEEEERICRTHGYVSQVLGVSRVNGELAVSRAFGDATYKEIGGPGPEDHPVCADPELLELHCDSTDFLILVCAGISKGSFPNAAVVKLAAAELKEHSDPGRASAAVCRAALRANSKDNLTCMIVLLGGGALEGPEEEFLPGPYSCPQSAVFTKAYEAMAAHAGVSLAEVLERRYSIAKRALEQATDESEARELRDEMKLFDEGPPDALVPGSQERREWFRAWAQEQKCEAPEESDPKRILARALADGTMDSRLGIFAPGLAAAADSSEPQAGGADSSTAQT